jgi:two-component system sensor histidine kinase and response regulator WspE
MIQFFITDTQLHANVIAEILNTATLDVLHANKVADAVKATQSINSAAKLCTLADLADLADALGHSLQLLTNRKIDSSDKLYQSIRRGLNIFDNLMLLENADLSDWSEENKEEINITISQLYELSDAYKKKQLDQQLIQKVEDKTAVEKISTGIDFSMLELFKVEAENQAKIIDENLLLLESDTQNSTIIEILMRASHSIKGAARMINFQEIVEIAHRMEDCFVNTQNGLITLDKKAIDLLLHCNDILETVAQMHNDDLPVWLELNHDYFNNSLIQLDGLAKGQEFELATAAPVIVDEDTTETLNEAPTVASQPKTQTNTSRSSPSQGSTDNSVRIQSSQLNKMLAVSNELLVSQNWLATHLGSLQLLKKRQIELANTVMKLRQGMDNLDITEEMINMLAETESRVELCRHTLNNDINQLDEYDRKSFILSSRLNQEVIASRMRHFEDGTKGFKRMVRDVAHDLGKEVRLELKGLDTLVDSDILEMIEAPLTHLLRNAIDHGIEMPEQRTEAGKPSYGLIRISAFHHAGLLNVTIEDDGKGIDLDKLKQKIINRGMVNEQMAENLSESELLDFLFLPGFSTREDVTEYSGRGVGLDVVHTVVTTLRGQIKSASKPGRGLSVQLQLPLTLSVLHSLQVIIGEEYYALPLSRIHTVIKRQSSDIYTVEDKQLIKYRGQDISLISGRQLLEYSGLANNTSEEMEIIVLHERGEFYALVVDEIVSETTLALNTIDSRLGKIKDISAVAITDDGKPVLILDVDDLLINIQESIGDKSLGMIRRHTATEESIHTKKVLVIDDSLTVREVEKNLLESRGYTVDIAIDGIDGWNTLRQGNYELVITDIDMPRMNGIELVTLIKDDPKYKSIPVMIVSYKDNPEDRQKGLEAGADYYLTKGSFHDEGLLDGVVDLIGEADE